MPAKIEIFLCEAPSDDADVIPMPPPDFISVGRVTSAKRLKELSFSRFYLDQILQNHYSLSLANFEKSADNKPFIKNSSLQISLSHSQDHYVYMFQEGDDPIGVDIEARTINDNFLKIAKRYGSPAEIKWILGHESIVDQKKEFRTLWSSKEAFYKAQDKGHFGIVKNLSVDFAKNRATYTDSTKKGEFVTIRADDYSLAAFSPQATDSIQFYKCTNQKDSWSQSPLPTTTLTKVQLK